MFVLLANPVIVAEMEEVIVVALANWLRLRMKSYVESAHVSKSIGR